MNFSILRLHLFLFFQFHLHLIKPKIVVKPKIPEQTQTKSDLKKVIIPASINIPINNVNHIHYDEIIVGSNQLDGNKQLK